MVTMRDVALRAGVSKATVSRVLAGHSYVSKPVRDKVLQAIAALGYRPNLVARNLATQRSHSIGLMAPNTLYHGPFFSELLYQAAILTEQSGSQLMLADGKHSAEQEREAIQFLADMRCDAMILYPRYLDVAQIDALIPQLNQPLVVLNRQLVQHPELAVCIDHQADAYAAVSALIARGHKRIAFIRGMSHSPTGDSRWQGYLSALQAQGLTLNTQLVAEGDWTPASGQRAASEILARKVAFTALVASNDDMAMGAAQALRSAGKQIPEDVSLMGFDDIPLAQWFHPPLSTVQVPMAAMVEQAIAQLRSMLAGEKPEARPLLRSQWVERDSVRALR
ncbi:LacI family DNA-binding transcriptional regulator [Candidatus Pantoea multigeneris]|uniref:LacI family transcriptional regulator n=1 Tax=Candidatus Pantoea multigeneris TaxID=2608357 RepID=A0ABX0RBY3_9GAMM|nr:LacI family DNA-binding transcriptional regulator [Pantoea multigeneris]NIF21821.1 LacI family transcriptional regulator [Pantoea multigeneris]